MSKVSNLHGADLTYRPCPRCRAIAKEVIHAQANDRRGWYCTACKHFEPAILRERLIK